MKVVEDFDAVVIEASIAGLPAMPLRHRPVPEQTRTGPRPTEETGSGFFGILGTVVPRDGAIVH